MNNYDYFQPVRHGMLPLGVIACVLAFSLARRISEFPLSSTADLLFFGNAVASLSLCGLSASTYAATVQCHWKALAQYSLAGIGLCLAALSGYVLFVAAQQSMNARYLTVGVTLPIVGFSSYGLLKLQGHMCELLNRFNGGR
jgi:hypothetical protein